MPPSTRNVDSPVAEKIRENTSNTLSRTAIVQLSSCFLVRAKPTAYGCG